MKFQYFILGCVAKNTFWRYFQSARHLMSFSLKFLLLGTGVVLYKPLFSTFKMEILYKRDWIGFMGYELRTQNLMGFGIKGSKIYWVIDWWVKTLWVMDFGSSFMGYKFWTTPIQSLLHVQEWYIVKKNMVTLSSPISYIWMFGVHIFNTFK